MADRKLLKERHAAGDKRNFNFQLTDLYNQRNAEASRALDAMKRSLPKVPPPTRFPESEDAE